MYGADIIQKTFCILKIEIMSFSKLPTELTDYIMKLLNFKDLLACREVSSSWNALSTRLLLDRFTELDNLWYDKPEGWKIFDVFGDDCLPWNSCVIPTAFDHSAALRNKFLSKFGSRILVCRFEDYFDSTNVAEIIGNMPNLVQLTMPKVISYLWEPGESLDGIQLPFLKLLKINFSAVQHLNENNLHHILSMTMPSLELLDIRDFHIRDFQSLQPIVLILQNLPAINLTIRSIDEFALPAFAAAKLNIQELTVQSSMIRSCCDLNFVSSLAQLKSLQVSFKPYDGPANPYFLTFPHLPSLTHLTIYTGNWIPHVEQEEVSLVIRFPGSLLPNLRKWTVITRLGLDIQIFDYGTFGKDRRVGCGPGVAVYCKNSNFDDPNLYIGSSILCISIDQFYPV